MCVVSLPVEGTSLSSLVSIKYLLGTDWIMVTINNEKYTKINYAHHHSKMV